MMKSVVLHISVETFMKNLTDSNLLNSSVTLEMFMKNGSRHLAVAVTSQDGAGKGHLNNRSFYSLKCVTQTCD